MDSVSGYPRTMRTLLLSLLFVSTQAYAGSLAGVTVPDNATVGGQELVLNGLGLREKWTIDVYIGSLYLPSKTSDAASIIADDVPKRLGMHFVYSSVSKQQLVDTYKEGLAKQPAATQAVLAPRYEQLYSMLTDVTSGQEVRFEYVPGTGTTVSIAGKTKGTITGADFMRSLFTIYLGESPPTTKLKRGMLGQ